MPTYDQLDNEAAWRDETEPPALLRLKAGIQARFPGAGVGIKGDNRHLRGAHRSRRWIKTSAHCTNRTYTVSRTIGDRSGGNENWCCAFDIWGLPQEELRAMCQRLDVAVRAGRLEKLTEWFGNLGGDSAVDGWDNISDRPASSDSSHLTHLHLTFDRGRANEDHSDLLAILTGEDMDQKQINWLYNAGNLIHAMSQGLDAVDQVNPETGNPAVGGAAGGHFTLRLDALWAKLATGPIPQPAPVDVPALAEALRPSIQAMVRQELDNTKLGPAA